MPHYRLYFLQPDNKSIGKAIDLDCETDDEAILRCPRYGALAGNTAREADRANVIDRCSATSGPHH